MFVRPVINIVPRGSHSFSQGTYSTYHRGGVFKSDSEARREAYQTTSAALSSISAAENLPVGSQLWDTAGQERFRHVHSRVNQTYTLIFYRYQICNPELLPRGCRRNLGVRHHKVRSRDSESDANRLTLPSSRASFLNLSRWLADARALGSPNLVVVLVGNKADREDDREVDWAEASKWAAENGVSLWNFT
jgi:GTPase SAR1 family protein